MPDQPSTAEQRLTELFSTHHGQVVAYVARRTRPLGDQAVSQEVAAEVFALAWQRLSDGTRATGGTRPVDDLVDISLPWLLVTARNTLSQHARANARRVAREERVMNDRSTGAPGMSPAPDPADTAALSEQVTRALDRLPADDRELLLLRAWDELPFAEVAAVLGCSPGAARVRWLRVRRRFADALTREGEDRAPHSSVPTDPSRPAPGVRPLPLTTTRTGEL